MDSGLAPFGAPRTEPHAGVTRSSGYLLGAGQWRNRPDAAGAKSAYLRIIGSRECPWGSLRIEYPRRPKLQGMFDRNANEQHGHAGPYVSG